MKWPDVGVHPTLPELLQAAVARHGSAEYIVTPADRMSFAEAELRSRAAAKALLAAGVGKGTRVGIVLPSGTDFAVAFLAARGSVRLRRCSAPPIDHWSCGAPFA